MNLRLTDNIVQKIERKYFPDARGYFVCNLDKHAMEQINDLGICAENYSFNHKYVARGMHYQSPYSQGKIVSCIAGSIIDFALNINPKSKEFGQVTRIQMSQRSPFSIWISPNFAHGFISLEDNSIVQYKTTECYHPEYEKGVNFNDLNLTIADQKLLNSCILTDKDSMIVTEESIRKAIT